jgi:hypothetical protein
LGIKIARKQRPLITIPKRLFMFMASSPSDYFGDEKSFSCMEEFLKQLFEKKCPSIAEEDGIGGHRPLLQETLWAR